MTQKIFFKELLGNQFWFAYYVMPILGMVFNAITLLVFYRKTYFFFFLNSTLLIYILLLADIKNNYDFKFKKMSTDIVVKWRGYYIWLWIKGQYISIHTANECVISSYSSDKWDKKINETLYNRLLEKFNLSLLCLN